MNPCELAKSLPPPDNLSARTDRVRTVRKQACKKCTLTAMRSPTILRNTLLSRRNSLILEIFSLLICLGNCSGKCCSAAVSCSGISCRSPEIAKFPVKFPDTKGILIETGAICTASPARQSRGRRCRSSMRRKARCWRDFVVWRRSLNSQIGELPGQFGKSLRLLLRIFPFWGDARRRRGPISTACSSGSPLDRIRRSFVPRIGSCRSRTA